MKTVYAVGVLKLNLSSNGVTFTDLRDSRLWFLFSTFENAERAVLENYSDLFECYYNIAIIEEIQVQNGSRKKLPGPIPKQWWYLADYSKKAIDIHPIPIPEGFFNICNFWVG